MQPLKTRADSITTALPSQTGDLKFCHARPLIFQVSRVIQIMRKITTSLLLLCLAQAVPAETQSPFNSVFQTRELQRLQFYRHKAMQGDAHAQFRVGWAYETGDGLPQDANAATRWYQRAARQGHMNARLNLAVMDPELTLDPAEQAFVALYQRGQAGDSEARRAAARQAVAGGYTRPELRQIFLWLQDLARGNDSESQHLLGTFYIQGRGVPQNFVRAYSWFSMAAAAGYAPAVASRDAVAQLMSASQLEQGQALSMEYYENSLKAVDHPLSPSLDRNGNVSQVDD